MKRETISNLSSRDNLIHRLVQNYKNGSASKVTLLTGPSGCGKSYIANRVALESNKLPGTYSYIDQGNSFVSPSHMGCNVKLNAMSLSLGLPCFSFGISADLQNDISQFNRVKSLLNGGSNSTVIFCVDDFSNAHSDVKSTLRILLSNWNKFEKEFNMKLFFLFADVSLNHLLNIVGITESLAHFNLAPYSTEDILEYLRNEHLGLIITEKVTQNISEIQKICNGNLALVDFLFADITFQDSSYFKALDQVIQCRLLQLKTDGQLKKISEVEMEDIILSSALSIQRFTTAEISCITNRSDNTVANILDFAREEAFLDKDQECLYDFCCPEVKSVLEKKSIEKRKERLLYYYKYFTQTEQDAYYVRAFYLIKFFGTITPQSFALVGLALVGGVLRTDLDLILKTDAIIRAYGSRNYIETYNTIKEFYTRISESTILNDPNEIHELYLSLCEAGLEPPLRGEICRAYFHYLYRMRSAEDILVNQLFDECLPFVEQELSLNAFPNPIGITLTDETIIRLNIIYSIAPYLLDVRNDVQNFTKLYQLSRRISQLCQSRSSKGLAQYIENVFNRKAFLFINETQCGPYYDKAKSYFERNQIWDELYLTLVCEAGTDVVIQKYDDAIRCCNQAIIIANQYGLSLPNPEKLQNNLLIAEFMKAEKASQTESLCLTRARQTISQLKKLLHNKACTTEYVILTNICSLCLYCGDDIGYLKHKDMIQHLMSCIDISDIDDVNIDDFYRYYFAWFEVYRMLRDKKWESVEKMYHKVCGFVPALFQKQERFWKMKEDALNELIKNRIAPSSYDFCNKLVVSNRRETILARFYLRGLMLSDLQYTSYN